MRDTVLIGILVLYLIVDLVIRFVIEMEYLHMTDIKTQ